MKHLYGLSPQSSTLVRDTTLIVDGVHLQENVPLEDTVRDELNNAIPIELRRSEIHKCSLFGPPPVDKKKTRSIKMKLSDPKI